MKDAQRVEHPFQNFAARGNAAQIHVERQVILAVGAQAGRGVGGGVVVHQVGAAVAHGGLQPAWPAVAGLQKGAHVSAHPIGLAVVILQPALGHGAAQHVGPAGGVVGEVKRPLGAHAHLVPRQLLGQHPGRAEEVGGQVGGRGPVLRVAPVEQLQGALDGEANERAVPDGFFFGHAGPAQHVHGALALHEAAPEMAGLVELLPLGPVVEPVQRHPLAGVPGGGEAGVDEAVAQGRAAHQRPQPAFLLKRGIGGREGRSAYGSRAPRPKRRLGGAAQGRQQRQGHRTGPRPPWQRNQKAEHRRHAGSKVGGKATPVPAGRILPCRTFSAALPSSAPPPASASLSALINSRIHFTTRFH